MISLPFSYWTLATILIGGIAILPTIMGFFGGNKLAVAGKTILITGASQGMGLAVARQLSAKGASIIIVARDIPKLKAALEEVKAAASNPSSQNFHFISADLTSAEGNTRVVDEATKWNNGRAPDIVWCIAGDSYPQFFIETPVEKLRWQMDINYWAATYMSHSILQSWLSPTSPSKGTERHFIFTSSVAALYPTLGYATYAPAKAAMRSLAETLTQEILVYGENVKIHTVFPGTIVSPGLDNENKSKPDITMELEKDDPNQTPDEVAAKAIKGLEKGETMITVGLLGQAMRSQMWSGVTKNNWLWDTLLTVIIAIAWPFIRMDLDGKVIQYGKKHGHPSTYVKRV